MNNTAIIVITYNRLDSLKRLLNSLQNAIYPECIPLIISVDKSDTSLVEEFSNNFIWNHGEKIVDKHQHNMGLKAHILSLGKWFAKYDSLIILEDDLEVSPAFFYYCSETISQYQINSDIAGVSLYSFSVNYINHMPFTPAYNGYDVYMMNCAMSWGQIWFKEQWNDFINWYTKHEDFSYTPDIPHNLFNWGKNSWLKYHTRYCIETNKYFVYPYFSFVTNNSDIGTHNSAQDGNLFQVIRASQYNGKLRLPLTIEDSVVYDGFFERKNIIKYLDLPDNETCIDLNATKYLEPWRYVLTTRKLNYKIIKTFGLKYKPIEDNVIYYSRGDDIFLYDTSISLKNSNNQRLIRIYQYHFQIEAIPIFIHRIGEVRILIDYISFCFNQFKKWLRIS